MEFNLKPGMIGEIEITVDESHTAVQFGSGGVKVLATPMMIALMEKAALTAVDPHLPEGFATVGTNLNVNHTAATPVGMKAWAKAELLEVAGKKLVFKVEAFDEMDKIGEGVHERFIVELGKFMERVNRKGK